MESLVSGIPWSDGVYGWGGYRYSNQIGLGTPSLWLRSRSDMVQRPVMRRADEEAPSQWRTLHSAAQSSTCVRPMPNSGRAHQNLRRRDSQYIVVYTYIYMCVCVCFLSWLLLLFFQRANYKAMAQSVRSLTVCRFLRDSCSVVVGGEV